MQYVSRVYMYIVFIWPIRMLCFVTKGLIQNSLISLLLFHSTFFCSFVAWFKSLPTNCYYYCYVLNINVIIFFVNCICNMFSEIKIITISNKFGRDVCFDILINKKLVAREDLLLMPDGAMKIRENICITFSTFH